jgi:hypothetical protein
MVIPLVPRSGHLPDQDSDRHPRTFDEPDDARSCEYGPQTPVYVMLPKRGPSAKRRRLHRSLSYNILIERGQHAKSPRLIALRQLQSGYVLQAAVLYLNISRPRGRRLFVIG